MIILRRLATPLSCLHKTGLRATLSTSSRHQNKSNTELVKEDKKSEPVKFSTSDAYLKYKASSNFYGDEDPTVPPSHNYVIAATCIFGVIYLFYLRDDIEGGGGADLIRPLHETMPHLAIPLLQSAIEENRRYGRDTKKLEKKLAELMDQPEKYGQPKKRLVEN